MSVIFDTASKERKSVFLVAPRGAALDSTTEFKEKGLAAFAPEKPSFLEYFGGRQRVSIAHDLYRANLAAIMFASIYKAPIPAVYTVRVCSSERSPPLKMMEQFYNLLGLTFNDKFLGTPTIGVSFSSPPGLELKETMGRLGYSTQEHRNMMQFIGPSSTDIVKTTLEQTPLVDVMVPYGVANLRGFMAWSVTVKLVTSFLRIHWEAVRNGFQTTTSIAIRPDAPNKKTFPSYRTTDSNDKASKFEKDDEAYKALSGASVDNTLIAMARCQDGAVSGYGPGDALPEFEHNMVFTYFDGMQLPDKFMPLTIMSTMFFYAMGTNFENCTNTMTMLRKGWSSLSTTVHGKAISHLLQGCQLAFETGAAIYAVIEARAYHGFVLVSHQPFWIGIRGKQVTSYAYSQAKIDLQLASSHVKALSQICKVVSGCFLRGQTAKEIIKRSDIQTARGLYIEVMKRQLSKDEKEEITRWADYLSFPQEYMKVTPANLAALFSAYSGKTEFTVGIPMFLGAGCIVSESRAVQLCAAFGVTAPSLIMPKGDICKVPIPGSGIDASIVADKDGRAFMPFIALYMKSVKAAASDLDKVFKSAEVSFRRGVKGGASKTQYQFIGANKDDIWRELADSISYKHSIDNAGKKKVDDKGKGKKRAADDDAGAPAKKARDEEDFSSFL